MTPDQVPSALQRAAIDLHHPDPLLIGRAAEIVRAGGVIVYPTDTVYGIGADATSEGAVRKVAVLKGRSEGKPVLVLVHALHAVEPLVADISPAARRLMEHFWPGPLTLVFPATDGMPDGITGGSRTIGIRLPSSVFCRRLAEEAGVPVTSTSANRAGQEIPATMAGIQAALGAGVDLYLDGGVLPASPPSTVVDVSVDPPRVLREGAVSIARLREVVPEVAAVSGGRG